jgi:tripartite-type tricarboxylate transporter receptor subunit TctC
MYNRRNLLKILSALPAAGVLRPAAALAQEYPNRPVRVVVPFPPGGAIDVVARIVCRKMSDLLGQQLFIENRAGASGKIGVVGVKQSEPDGYSLAVITSVTHGTNPAVSSSLGYDPMSDLIPIVALAEAPHALLVNRKVSAHTVPELIELTRAQPGKLNYASGGIGSMHHLGTVMMLMQSKLPQNAIVHVPYQGQAPAFADLVSGTADVMISSIGSGIQFIERGDIRALATTGRRRFAGLPDVPTMSELGFRDFDVIAWVGIAAPQGTPKPILDRVNQAANTALTDPAVKAELLKADFEPIGGTPDAFSELIKSEVTRWKSVVAGSGMKFD